MNYDLLMDKAQRVHYTRHEELRLLLREHLQPRNMVPKVTSRVHVKHQVQIVLVLKSILHIDYERMLQ